MATNVPATIPSDSPSIFDALSAADENALVRPNNPPPGIAGFLFDIPEDERMELESKITDYYIEDNTTIQDNIALAPETFTVKGLISEVVGFTPGQNQQPQAAIPDALPINPTMTPDFTPQASQTMAQNAAATEAQSETAQASQSLYQYFIDQSQQQPTLTRQSSAFLFFYQMWKGKQLFSVQTPWGMMLNMAILRVSPLQEEDSIYKSNFTVTFKKIRITGSATVAAGQLAGRAVAQTTAATVAVQPGGIAGQAEATPQQAISLTDPFAPPPSR